MDMKNSPDVSLSGSVIRGPISVELTVPKGQRPAAEVANFFQMAHVGPEIQMLVGYIDPQLIASRAEQERSKRPPSVTGPIVVRSEPELTHRFSISPQGFATLRAAVESIAKTLDTR